MLRGSPTSRHPEQASDSCSPLSPFESMLPEPRHSIRDCTGEKRSPIRFETAPATSYIRAVGEDRRPKGKGMRKGSLVVAAACALAVVLAPAATAATRKHGARHRHAAALIRPTVSEWQYLAANG